MESYDKPRLHIKKQRYHFANKGLSSQNHVSSSSHVWMWELDYKESWAPKNWSFWIVVLEKTLEIPWTVRRSNQSILKEINPEYSLEGLMLKLKLQYSGHLLQRAKSLEKNPDAGKDWRQKEKGAAEDEMVAAAAKPLWWCPTLCNPIDGSPPGSAVPGILQARTLE